jgi:hypothetical protein
MFATSIVRLRNHIRLVHAASGAPITGQAIGVLPYGWHARTVPDGIVVSARTDVTTSLAQLVVTVTDAVLADCLVFPPGLPPRTVLVPLALEQVDVSLRPVPMTLTVELVTPLTGVPRTGRTVTATATDGQPPAIALPELDLGVYRSAPVEWTAAFTPAELLVDGALLRTVPMDLRRTTTRVRLVDTT